MYTAFIRALIIAYLIPSKRVHLFHLEYFLMGFLYVYIIKISSRDIYKAKKKNMCVSCYMSKKIRVGRSLLIFFFLFIFFFFLILPRNTTDALFARTI